MAADNLLTFRDSTQSFDLAGALKKVADASSAQDVLAPLRSVLSSLEALTKVHPFLAIAVIPFKAIVSLELKRRENDRRILVVITQMADMMSHLSTLPAQQTVNTTQQNQLQDVLVNVKVLGLHRFCHAQYIQRLVANRAKSLTVETLSTFITKASSLASVIYVFTRRTPSYRRSLSENYQILFMARKAGRFCAGVFGPQEYTQDEIVAHHK